VVRLAGDRLSAARVGVAFVAGCGGLLIAALMAGGGHGTYLPAKVLFPYTMIMTAWSGDSITLWGVAVAILQMPAYVAALDRARGTASTRRWAIGIAALHVACVMVSIVFIRNFPEAPGS
jgi:hypothetical protein